MTLPLSTKPSAEDLAEADRIARWMRNNEFRLGQVQGFGYGTDRRLFTVRDCWLASDSQVVWQKQSSKDTEEADHQEMVLQIEAYRLGLAFRETAALTSARTAAAEDMRERAAKWHAKERAELQAACDAAWPEYVPELGLHAIKVHERSEAAIRALPVGGE